MKQTYDWDYGSNSNPYWQEASTFSPETQSAAGLSSGSTASAGAAGGSMGPAAIMMGGSFLTNYMNQKAQEEENKKKMLTELALKQGDNESNYMKNLMDVYRQSLLGGK